MGKRSNQGRVPSNRGMGSHDCCVNSRQPCRQVVCSFSIVLHSAPTTTIKFRLVFTARLLQDNRRYGQDKVDKVDKDALGSPLSTPYSLSSHFQSASRYSRAETAYCSLFGFWHAQSWNLDARPVLWDRFSCANPQLISSPWQREVWLRVIRKRANLFQHVNSHNNPIAPEIREILVSQCHNLVTINVRILDDSWTKTLGPLIEQNRISLQRLGLQADSNSLMASLQPPRLLASMPHLRSLELGVPRMTVGYLVSLLDACPSSLECLDLRSDVLRGRQTGQEGSVAIAARTDTSLQLKRLRIHGNCSDGTFEDVLSRLAAHSLEELRIGRLYSFEMTPTLLQDKLWRLAHLHLNNMLYPESILPKILGAIPPHQLRWVHLGCMDTGCTAKLVEQQHQSLESLSIHFILHHEGALGSILATCGKLRKLVFTVRTFVDIEDLCEPQKPWVCTELEVFDGPLGEVTMFSSCTPPPPLLHLTSYKDSAGEVSMLVRDIFLQRLAQLTKLRRVEQRRDSEGRIGSWTWMEIMDESLATKLNASGRPCPPPVKVQVPGRKPATKVWRP